MRALPTLALALAVMTPTACSGGATKASTPRNGQTASPPSATTTSPPPTPSTLPSHITAFFRPVLCYLPKASASAVAGRTLSQATCSEPSASSIASTSASDDAASATVLFPYYDNSFRFLLGPADLNASSLSGATPELNPTTGQYTVLVTFSASGTTSFDQLAAMRYRCYQQDPSNPPSCALEAFEVDGVVESAPAIEASSFNGEAVITGSTANPFTRQQAGNLAVLIKYAAVEQRG